jgi:hypothetical protein
MKKSVKKKATVQGRPFVISMDVYELEDVADADAFVKARYGEMYAMQEKSEGAVGLHSSKTALVGSGSADTVTDAAFRHVVGLLALETLNGLLKDGVFEIQPPVKTIEPEAPKKSKVTRKTKPTPIRKPVAKTRAKRSRR